jgi:hypothetical protein
LASMTMHQQYQAQVKERMRVHKVVDFCGHHVLFVGGR